jgi:hypothetical protein
MILTVLKTKTTTNNLPLQNTRAMKKIFYFFLMIALTTVSAMGQNGPVDEIFEKYGNKDGFTTVYISKYMFDMFGSVETNSQEDKDLKQVTSKLEGIRILTLDENSESENSILFSTMLKELPVTQYRELMNIKEKDQLVKFLVREQNNRIIELLMVVSGKSDNALISIKGDIDLKTISKLSGSMQIQGMENLDKVK